MAQWWECSPPTNVDRVQILASTPYVDWVCCWFSPLLREVFLRVLRFSPLLKTPTFPNSNSTRNQVNEEPLCRCATSKSLFVYLFIYLFIYFPYIEKWVELEPVISWKLVTCQPRENNYLLVSGWLQKTRYLDGSAPEPTIWLCDTGQRMPYFDSCQLTITWMYNIR